ncbi:MAG: DUF559 domain-containing protein, partial [candidate division Zixibacteria bacterium]|nr:DUF559 domain-containing protein [candidate division Zixibacteria bacterium]
YDKERTKILEQYELTLIRFTNKEVMQNLSGVYQALLQQIAEKKNILTYERRNKTQYSSRAVRLGGLQPDTVDLFSKPLKYWSNIAQC